MNTIQKALLLVGLVGLGSSLAVPALAGSEQAYASGSSTLVLMNGASYSVGGEIAAPKGAAFVGATGTNGDVAVLVTFQGDVANLSDNTVTIDTLDINPDQATVSPNASSSMEAAVATQINTAAIGADLDKGVSYTRAWVSGGLD